MTGIPSIALTVRQPWAWGIIHAGKDVENRYWKHPPRRFIGQRVAIHAAQGMTRIEYDGISAFMSSIGVLAPPAAALVRGAIIGSVTIMGSTRVSTSPWFLGPLGLILADPVPCEPIPARGALGFFQWTPAPEMAPVKSWMKERL